MNSGADGAVVGPAGDEEIDFAGGLILRYAKLTLAHLPTVQVRTGADSRIQALHQHAASALADTI